MQKKLLFSALLCTLACIGMHNNKSSQKILPLTYFSLFELRDGTVRMYPEPILYYKGHDIIFDLYRQAPLWQNAYAESRKNATILTIEEFKNRYGKNEFKKRFECLL